MDGTCHSKPRLRTRREETLRFREEIHKKGVVETG